MCRACPPSTRRGGLVGDLFFAVINLCLMGGVSGLLALGAVGALLVGLGMLPLGAAVLRARRLPGWQRYAPLLVGLYYAAMIPIQVVFFIGPNGTPSNTLLAFWG